MTTVIEQLLNCPLTPSEMVSVTRTIQQVKPNGAETTIKVNVGEFKVFVSPPDTLNKNDGAILEQLLAGNKTRKVYMMYGLCPDIKDGDTVYRGQTDKAYYEVKIVGYHGDSFNMPEIRHHKCYIVYKDNQKPQIIIKL